MDLLREIFKHLRGILEFFGWIYGFRREKE